MYFSNYRLMIALYKTLEFIAILFSMLTLHSKLGCTYMYALLVVRSLSLRLMIPKAK